MKKEITIGSRESRLAVIQSEQVAGLDSEGTSGAFGTDSDDEDEPVILF